MMLLFREQFPITMLCEVLGLPRIGLVHAVENPASCRVAESAGFALEGTARQEFEHADGRRYDYHHHARLAADPW